MKMAGSSQRKKYNGPSLKELGVTAAKLKKYRVLGPEAEIRSSRFVVATKAGRVGKNCGALYGGFYAGLGRNQRLKSAGYLAEMQCQIQYKVSRKFEVSMFDGLLFVDFGLRSSIDYEAIPCISYLMVKQIFERDEDTMRNLFITARSRGPVLLPKTLKAMGATRVGAWVDAIGKADVYRLRRSVLEGNGIVVKKREDWSELSDK